MLTLIPFINIQSSCEVQTTCLRFQSSAHCSSVHTHLLLDPRSSHVFCYSYLYGCFIPLSFIVLFIPLLTYLPHLTGEAGTCPSKCIHNLQALARFDKGLVSLKTHIGKKKIHGETVTTKVVFRVATSFHLEPNVLKFLKSIVFLC